MDMLMDALIGNAFGPHTPMDYVKLVALFVFSFAAGRMLFGGRRR